MIEYHKIETLYERDEATHRLKSELILKNRVYDIVKSWHWTEKIDGTNIRCDWDPETGKVLFGGRTDNANLPADLINYLRELATPEKLRAIFPDSAAVIFGEGYGAGIQKGGDYSPTKKFIVFDVLVGGKWWLSWENTVDVALKMEMDTVPYFGEMTLAEATEFVRRGFQSKLNGGKMKAEGLVGRTVEPLFDKKGARLIVKLKTRDF